MSSICRFQSNLIKSKNYILKKKKALTVPQNMVVNLLWVVLEGRNIKKLTVIRNYDMLQSFLFI